jgi:hypothetical protein
MVNWIWSTLVKRANCRSDFTVVPKMKASQQILMRFDLFPPAATRNATVAAE